MEDFAIIAKIVVYDNPQLLETLDIIVLAASHLNCRHIAKATPFRPNLGCALSKSLQCQHTLEPL
jgi:hypothetical protein